MGSEMCIRDRYMSVREFVRASAEPSRIKGSIGQKAVNNDSWKDSEFGT